MTPIEGVDYAFGTRPAPSELVRQGKQFVVRYGGPGTDGKWIHADEARALAAAGIWIVANAEGSAQGLLGGYSAGVSWATSALAWFRGIGMPKGRPIYFSVDFDVTSTQWPTVAAALKGAASVIGADCVGVYGGLRAIEWAMRDGVARWLWQTYAWSGGYWVPGTHLQQYHNGVNIGGADCDLDRAMQADYGQWMPGITFTGGDDMSWADRFPNPSAPGEDASASDFLRYANAYAYQAVTGVKAVAASLEELKSAVAELKLAGAGTPVSATLDAESLAAALRPMVSDVVRAELNKSHLTDN